MIVSSASFPLSAPAEHATGTGRCASALVIDDQSASRAVVSRILQSIDATLDIASFAEPSGAVEWARNHHPSLIITDYRMPNMDGIEVVRTLREMESTRQTPIIVIT